MACPVKASINRHVIRFHEIPVTVQQSLFGCLVPNLVKGCFIYLPESNIGIVKNAERNIRFTFTTYHTFAILVLNKAGTNPVDGRVCGQQHPRCLESIMDTPTQSGKKDFHRFLGNLGNLIHQSNGIFRRAEALKVRVAGNIGHLFHDDYRIVPECQCTFEIVDFIIDILLQAPIFQYGLNGVPCRFF